MRWKVILSFIFILLAIALIFSYFTPLSKINFIAKTGNSNFSIADESGNMQFYQNMRFPESQISYRISNCALQKENDMESAFSIMENLTSLSFYPAENNEEISITCDEKYRQAEETGMFIAGEGGPTNITISGDFNVITKGEILLIKNSNCEKPNIAIHELLHVLGFGHSGNPENIMYNVTDCEQTLGQDQINLLDKLYSYPSYPDLLFENISAVMNGRFLSINITVRNSGLSNAGDSEIDIYADGTSIKKIDMPSLETGSGRIIYLGDIFVTKINIEEIELEINSNFNELDKSNNNASLKIEK